MLAHAKCFPLKGIFYPPDQRKWLLDERGRFLTGDVNDPGTRARFPGLSKACSVRVVQGTGETVFVPSGWIHQVRNMVDTLSINHNWGNACNVGRMYTALHEDLETARKEIADCRDMDGWHDQCQLLLRANCGMDMADMARMMLRAVRPAVHTLRQLLAPEHSASLVCILQHHRGGLDATHREASRQSPDHARLQMAVFVAQQVAETLGRMGPDWFGADMWREGHQGCLSAPQNGNHEPPESNEPDRPHVGAFGSPSITASPTNRHGGCAVCGRPSTAPLLVGAGGEPEAFWKPCRDAARGGAVLEDECMAWFPVLWWAAADISALLKATALQTTAVTATT